MTSENANQEISMEMVARKEDEIGKTVVEVTNADQKDYDPYANRSVKHPTTNRETLFHLLKGSLGTGILAMPHAFSHSGYIIGTLGTVIVGFLCTYCIHLLINAQIKLCKRVRTPSMSYTQVATEALKVGPNWAKPLSPFAGPTVNMFLLIYQLGTCCVYLVFVSENIKAVINLYLSEPMTVQQYMSLALPAFIAINFIRNLKFLAPFSTLANCVTICSFGIILYYVFDDMPSLHDRTAFGTPSKYSLSFGTVLFALEAIGVMLPLENEMERPQDFVGATGVLNRGMIMIVTLYVIVGLAGYLRYGEAAAGSITLNLPSEEMLAQGVQVGQAFAIFITHGLACYVAIQIIWTEYTKPRFTHLASKKRIMLEYVVRILIVLFTYLVAVVVPALDLFISLFGALCLSALGLAFPCIIEICTHWDNISKKQLINMCIRNFFIFIIAIYGFVVGTYTSLEALVHEFSHHSVNETLLHNA